MKTTAFEPVFSKYMPNKLNEGFLYISKEYGASKHLCPCGCGESTYLPFNTETSSNPNEWKLIDNNGLITFEPSIGSFQLPCKSHYWIRENKVVWA